MPGALNVVPYLIFVLVLLVFWLPGFLWATWWHRAERFHWTFLAVLGFAWSLALFAAIGWPFLWLQGSFRQFLSVLALFWFAYAIVSIVAYWRHRRGSTVAHGVSPVVEPSLQMNRAGDATRLNLVGWWSVYLVVAFILMSLPLRLRDADLTLNTLAWYVYLGFALCFVLGGAYLMRCSGPLTDWLKFAPSDDFAAPRWVVAIALAFIGLQAASAVVFDRPDWDDCYYLAAVLDYAESDTLNAEEPTHREGFPVSPINRLLAWELWGAVLCYFSGLNPMAIFHSLLPAVLVLLAYAAYYQLLAEFVPRRWAPLALMALATWHLWGISSHSTPANFLLPRTAQGKTVLMHLAIPVVLVLIHRFARAPSRRRWFGLLAGAVFGLAASSSAVFLLVMLLACAGIALAIVEKKARSWHVVLGVIAACLPSITYGLLLHQSVMVDPALVYSTGINFGITRWCLNAEFYAGWGGTEILWVLLLPLSWLLLVERSRRWYLVFFPLVLFLTFGNPVLADTVSYYVTGRATYFRTFWLYPVAVGLGVFAALFSRLAARALSTRLGLQLDVLAMACVVLLLAGSWFVPGFYVWGSTNVAIITQPRDHPITSNLLKMPTDLQTLAEHLLAEPPLSDVRILADESITSYLTPYSRRFRLVQTRPLYSLYEADLAGRRDEGVRRYLLSLLLVGELPRPPGGDPVQFEHPFYPLDPFPEPPAVLTADELRPWLDELRVSYAITPAHASDKVHQSLAAVGFERQVVLTDFTLWKR